MRTLWMPSDVVMWVLWSPRWRTWSMAGLAVRTSALNPRTFRSRALDHALVEPPPEAGSLPVGVDHVGDVGEAGGVLEVAAGGDDAFVLGRPDDGGEGHVALVVDAA